MTTQQLSNSDWGAKGVFEEKKKEQPVQDIFGIKQNKKMKADTGAFPTLPGFEEQQQQKPEESKSIFNEKSMP